MRQSTKQTMLARNDIAFSQWWGRYVMELTQEDMFAGYASTAALRAAESAWKASALLYARPAEGTQQD